MTLKRIVPLLFLGFMLVGCFPIKPLASPDPTSIPTSIPTQTPLPLPSSTPSPIPTPIPTPLPAARQAHADQLLQNGDYEGALNEYQTILESSPTPEEEAPAWLGIARVKLLQEQYPAAIDILNRVIDQYAESPARAEAYFFLGRVYEALKRDNDAAQAYANYLEIKPEPLTAYVQELRGDALTKLNDYTAANSAYQSALDAPHLGGNTTLEFKIARNLLYNGEYQAAVDKFNALYVIAGNDYTKADIDLLCGQAYLALNNPDAAYERYLDAVVNFPRSNSSYAALLALVDAGVPVNDLYRGIVDYFAGQYAVAAAALDRYIQSGGEQTGTALHYKALTMAATEQYNLAIQAWNELIQGYPNDPFWVDAWDQKAQILWMDLGDYSSAAQTLLDYVATVPTSEQAPQALFDAGRILERDDQLVQASGVWERLGSEYPSAEVTFRGLFFAGITRYRLKDFNGARTDFQRGLLLSDIPADQAAANFWIGKTQLAENDPASAKHSWEQAQNLDPTGYYSERATDLLSGEPPFTQPETLDLATDPQAEEAEAETWLRSTFAIPPETDLSGLGNLADDPRIQRGREFWSLGLYNEARLEFEDLRNEISHDPAGTFRLVRYLESIGMYRSAIMGARQILALAGMSDAETLNAPSYFTHIRFGTYYKDLVFDAAEQDALDPLLIFSLMRQESLFEGFVQSGAGARGLMQIVPSTGQGIAASLGWPTEYTSDDLYRPTVSIRLGVHYLANQLGYFQGDFFAALAAYNAGPGNAMVWKEMSGDDPDLFLEVVRIQETRTYIMYIYENYAIYRRLYSR